MPELDSPIRGQDLGRILIERGLTPQEVYRAVPDIQFRAHTDGSLFDAMRFVTGTHRCPDHLRPCEPDWGVDPSWDEKLAAVEHPGLRDALRDIRRTKDSARSDGVYYRGADDPHFGGPARWSPAGGSARVRRSKRWSSCHDPACGYGLEPYRVRDPSHQFRRLQG